MNKIRWAIVGTGYIANSFAQGMQVMPDAVLAAVVSRNQGSAEAFAEKYGGEKTFTDYRAMLEEVKPDVVYLAMPNDLHYEYIMPALDCGVNVLSEKPMVDTVKQMEEVYKNAAEKGLFIMEGMWTRCFPVVRKVREWIAEGRIGEPLTVNVCFDIKPDYSDWQTWKAGIAHSGGALRDVGIYSLAVANMVFPGTPEKVFATMKSNGEVDEACRLMLDYGNGKTAFAGGGFNQNSNHTARIVGSLGSISFGSEFWHPTFAELKRNDGSIERFEDAYKASGFEYEIMAVQAALREGKKECADFTHAESHLIAGIIEDTRKSWGIAYRADEQ